MNKYFLLIIIVFGLMGCKPSSHFEENTSFENNNWRKFDDLTFHIPVESGKSYTFEGIITTDSIYNHRKMEIGFYLYMPGGEERLTDHSIRIRDFEHQNLGEETKDGYRLWVPLKKSLRIDETGNLKLNINLHSQYLDNYGIISFNLLVSED